MNDDKTKQNTKFMQEREKRNKQRKKIKENCTLLKTQMSVERHLLNETLI